MPASLRLLLPEHVRSQHMLYVIGKCVGVPNHQAKLGTNGLPVDFSQPISQTNDWYIRFEHRGKDFAIIQADHVNDMGFGHVVFQDIAGSKHWWAFAPEQEDEDGQLLFPDSDALAVAVGRRLLRFFGGTLKYHDGKDPIDERRQPGRALYPPKNRRDPSVNSNTRFAQFYNALHLVPLLTPQELDSAASVSAYGMTEPSAKLRAQLEIHAQHHALDRATPTPSTPRRRQRL